jgi:hypothetical protein
MIFGLNLFKIMIIANSFYSELNAQFEFEIRYSKSIWKNFKRTKTFGPSLTEWQHFNRNFLKINAASEPPICMTASKPKVYLFFRNINSKFS